MPICDILLMVLVFAGLSSIKTKLHQSRIPRTNLVLGMLLALKLLALKKDCLRNLSVIVAGQSLDYACVAK